MRALDAAGEMAGDPERTRFLLSYKFGLDEVMTKVNILRQELTLTHDYNPIEHVKSRLKSADSILDKARRRGCGTTAEEIRAHITDVAGVRIVCSFTTDVYEIGAMLTSQSDLQLLRTRDYIASPKPNGYRSLHLLVEIPVFLSDRIESVTVEFQLRTVAMDFWASLEHKAVFNTADRSRRPCRTSSRRWRTSARRSTHASRRCAPTSCGGRRDPGATRHLRCSSRAARGLLQTQ